MEILKPIKHGIYEIGLALVKEVVGPENGLQDTYTIALEIRTMDERDNSITANLLTVTPTAERNLSIYLFEDDTQECGYYCERNITQDHCYFHRADIYNKVYYRNKSHHSNTSFKVMVNRQMEMLVNDFRVCHDHIWCNPSVRAKLTTMMESLIYANTQLHFSTIDIIPDLVSWVLDTGYLNRIMISANKFDGLLAVEVPRMYTFYNIYGGHKDPEVKDIHLKI